MSDSTSQQNYPQVWRWLASLLAPKWTLIVWAAIGVGGAAFSLLALAHGAQFLVDKSLLDASGRELNHALMVMIGSAALMAVSSYIRLVSVNALSDYLGRTLRTQVFGYLLKLDTQYHVTHSSGDFVSRLGMEIGQVQSATNGGIPNGIRNIVLLGGALIMMAMTSPHLSLLTFLVVPLLSLPVMVMAPRLRRMNRDFSAVIAAKMSFLTERLGAIRTVQMFAAEPRLMTEMAQHHDNITQNFRTLIRMRATFTALVIVIVFSLIAFILWSGGRLVLEGRLSQGEVAAFVMYAIIAAGSLATLMDLGQSVGQARAALERLHEVLSEPVLLASPAQPKPVPASVPPIGFDNVTFAYPGSASPVLRGISFDIASRETVALVGPSGAGKSTVFALLARLYDPQSGVIRLDGVDIRDFDPRALRALFGIIPQEPDIFALSVGENIGFGLDQANALSVETAARAANAAGFIETLEQGYDTILGERGVGLSVGQKQRLAIARALVRDPKILLMDEATSALDAESERLVQQALLEAAQNRTALIIAHRLATIRSADRILVLDKGQVVASGKHDDLVSQGGLYAHLASLQFLA